ncbi:MAG: BadF/BadG/BcrA/BcrD ATPase family protein [Acidobacteriota bacterium]
MTAVKFHAGIDVGSTTVKAIVADADTDDIVWKDYRRHETRQVATDNCRTFMTGSGGNMLADMIGAKFVQEVLAASLLVEKRCPEAASFVEIGGQDAKIVIMRKEPESGRIKKIPSMNDKCAGGTGAIIDKISTKLGIPLEDLCHLRYRGLRVHPVAGKCGVFAETDINGLQKQGIRPEELMASLFEAFVLQNLKVLARGHTLLPHVLLRGGPNAFIPGMQEAWQQNIALMWKERGIPIPEGASPEDLIRVPENAEYYGALGAIEFGKEEDLDVGRYLGLSRIEDLVKDRSAGRRRGGQGMPALVGSEKEVEDFLNTYAPPRFEPPKFKPGDIARGFIGVDGGSTSTKAVLLSLEGEVLARAYQLSKGNPIKDTVEILEKLRKQVEEQGASIEVLGAATTGYAKDTLRDVICADVALVETVAHTKSALHYYDIPDAIVDVGGQDIKLIILKDGRVKDFKLNTQCSAGNGYFLQAISEGFGFKVEQFADIAFTAREMPIFPYGCAVFLQSDIASFQGQGYKANEILAGLAAVLPKNVWLYIAKIPNLPELGTRFILQGGTQNNLAAVKAQVDFIRQRFLSSGKTPEIIVHKHAGEAGAIGAAFEAMTLWQQGRKTSFIGLDAVRHIEYRTTVGEETRCSFCKNNCLRTFIDIGSGNGSGLSSGNGTRRLIVATCEKGTVEDVSDMKAIQAELNAARKANPNLLDYAGLHNLLFEKHKKKPIDCIFFPMFDVLRSSLVNIRASNACPTTALTPEVVRAAFTKEANLFAQNGIRYLYPILDMSRPYLLARQMFAEWRSILGLSRTENLEAVEAGYKALDQYEISLRRKSREIIDGLEKEGGVGIVLLGRPYHHDPGISQGIPEELQKRGYPVFSQSTLPLDQDLLDRLFGEEVKEGIISHPLDVSDVWKHTFSCNSSNKIWAAKFTARHPNLVAVELSNFKCGHDAPIYATIEKIIETSGTPYFAFKDIDENKPAGSIKLRVETIDYFLKRYRKELQEKM